MKRFSNLFGMSLLVLSLMLAVPKPAAAHVLKEDQGISAVLHMPPDDNPIAGEPTEIDFSFGDDSNHFSLTNCACTISVKRGSQTIYSAKPSPALKGATLDSFNQVTFPAAGAYDLLVDGTAKAGGFNSFHLSYIVRVGNPTNSANATAKGQAVLVIGVGTLSILALIAFNSIQAGGKYAAHSKTRKRSKS